MDNGTPEKALDLYEQITEKPDDVLYSVMFSACAAICDARAIELGNKLLRQIPMVEKKNIVFTGSVLNMLMKFGQVKDAEKLFQSLENKDQVTLGAMIQG